jgi:DNA-binding GntR family transcriptional regulator
MQWWTALQTSADRSAVARIYTDVKTRILEGRFRLRERLDVDALARSHKVSATPVRQALASLAFERLIASHPARGFQVMLWSAEMLRDLYQWRGQLACLAAEAHAGDLACAFNDAPTYADAVARVLQRLNAAANAELVRAATNADDRLRPARLAEPALFATCEEELAALAKAIGAGPRAKTNAALQAYHERRAARAAEIRAYAILRALPDDGE